MRKTVSATSATQRELPGGQIQELSALSWIDAFPGLGQNALSILILLLQQFRPDMRTGSVLHQNYCISRALEKEPHCSSNHS